MLREFTVYPSGCRIHRESQHRVQVGAYTQKSNAEHMKKKLKEAGYDSTIVQE
ncbi:SPOR domain-containing protein [Clostridiaceae bacterium OM08-6BH]|nr:SPOR domain-containing protein [Clostridiaceae bacterium OM08-6BH]